MESFWSKLRKTSGCWLWTGYLSGGYGQLRVNGKTVYAHRHAWELTHGPTTQDVLHTCGHRACCNPKHLFVGRASDHRQYARGIRVALHKLSEDDVRRIRLSRQSQSELAKRFGVSQSNISCVTTRKTWRHL